MKMNAYQEQQVPISAYFTESQRQAMIAFHRKAEEAYRQTGQVKQVEQAKALREKLEAKMGRIKK